ncbi:MAG TPA: acyl-homoserine-lactone synthase, partial [Albitalea sp.]|nr:acyl-homoserine-lactone synthase [Albitalea sp.]
ESGDVAGSARLLPTTRPYLLGDVFPQLLHGQPVPATSAIWELSRFAAVDFSAAKTSALSQFSSPVAVGLLRAAMRCAAERGAERLITVSPLGIERLLRRYGFRAHRAAPPLIVDGHPLFACLIELDEPTLRTH